MHHLYVVFSIYLNCVECVNNWDTATVPAVCSMMLTGQEWHILTVKCLIHSWLNLELVYELVKGSSPQYLQAMTQPAIHTIHTSLFSILPLAARGHFPPCGSSGSSPPAMDSSPSSLPSGGVTFQLQAELQSHSLLLCRLNIYLQGGPRVTLSPLNHVLLLQSF